MYHVRFHLATYSFLFKIYVGTSASSIHRFNSENWANYELIFTANQGEVVGVAFPQ